MEYTISGDQNVTSGFAIGKYIGTIRNSAKKEYAHTYYIWCLKGRKGKAPDRRMLLNGTLGLMAEQAVRMRIDELLKGTEFGGEGW